MEGREGGMCIRGSYEKKEEKRKETRENEENGENEDRME